MERSIRIEGWQMNSGTSLPSTPRAVHRRGRSAPCWAAATSNIREGDTATRILSLACWLALAGVLRVAVGHGITSAGGWSWWMLFKGWRVENSIILSFLFYPAQSHVFFNVPLCSSSIDLWLGSALDVFMKFYPGEELRFSHFWWDLSLVLVPLVDLYEGSKG